MAAEVLIPKSNKSMVVVCFLAYLLLEGLQRVSGVLFLASRDSFQTGRRSAAIPFALCRATENIAGTFFHPLKNHRKSGKWIQWGCFLSGVGIAICFLTTQVVWLSVFWGVVFGIGIGLASPLLAVELKKRENPSTISSLYAASPSFGCIVLPSAINALIACYGLNGCYVILAGIILNCIPFIMIARYRIRFHLPKSKWSLRKKCKRYEISEKGEEGKNTATYRSGDVKEFINESFIQNLEPDSPQIISDNEESVSGITKEYLDILQPIIEAKLKMATEQANDRGSFGAKENMQQCLGKSEFCKEKLSGLIDDMEEYEKSRLAFATSFSHNILESEDSENYAQPAHVFSGYDSISLKSNAATKSFNDIIEEKEEKNDFAIENLEKKLQDNSTKTRQEANFLDGSEKEDNGNYFVDPTEDKLESNKNDKESNCSEKVNEEDNSSGETVAEEKPLNKCYEINQENPLLTGAARTNNSPGNEKENQEMNSLNERTEEELKEVILNGLKNISNLNNSLLKSTAINNAKKFLAESNGLKGETDQQSKEIAISSHHQSENPPVIESSNSTFHIRKKTVVGTGRKNFPLEIKVHVVECTISTSEESLGIMLSNETVSKKGCRRHSNSLISGCYDDIDFTKLILNNKSSAFHENQANLSSRMCLITEEDEYDSCGTNATPNNCDIEAHQDNESSPNKRPIVKTLEVLTKPSCLSIIYASVTYEFTLAVLLTIFADLAKDTGDLTLNPNVVLAAFGIGGIVGQMSFKYCGSRLLVDGSHAAAAVIFMLNGLAAAGILWSSNISWLSGFYATLGFVERGIMFTLPKITLDYTDPKSENILAAVCRCLSGVALLCIPCSIGFSRDDTGDYDGLLQVTSCLSVLCAVLCYFLPKMTTRNDKTPISHNRS